MTIEEIIADINNPESRYNDLNDHLKNFYQKLVDQKRVSELRALELAENLSYEDQILVLGFLEDEDLLKNDKYGKPLVNDDRYIPICSVVSPDGGPYSYDRKIRPNDVFDKEAVTKIGEEMVYKNFYPGCMTEQLFKMFKTTDPFKITTKMCQIYFYLDHFQIGVDAILEGSIIDVRDPFSKYEEYITYLDVFTWSHLTFSDQAIGLPHKEYEAKILNLAKYWIKKARNLTVDKD